jgi:glycosyltransferase involved in cell wall biosynthesis
MNPSETSNPNLLSPFASPAQPERYPIIVHSHLGWDWVWQRPQQFLSRLSRNHRVLFIEGPVPADVPSAQLTLREVPDYPNIIVLQMRLPETRWNDGAWVDQERRRQVQSILAGPLGRVFDSPVQWFYDPMAVTAFAGHLEERAIVYDCMDELSLFRGAPAELVRRERELLAVADVVFAGGPKMWKAKREANANCFCFGCGVDAKHFAQARDRDLPLPVDMVDLPKPVFGYIGVVDERIDYDLLAALADSTSGSVAMIGPWTKVDRDAFPQRENLHWLGGRDYAQLPACAAAFDVCLMPFALNDATKFINPTKALEYMATGRTIVSTPIEDVVLQFSDVVNIGGAQEEFIRMCRQAAETPNSLRIRRGLEIAANNSWDSIVQQLDDHVLDIVSRKRSVATDAA